MDRLKPWQRLRHPCYEESCSLRAVQRVESDGELRALGCETHADQFADELCDIHGSASTSPVRATWRMWLWSPSFMQRLEVYLNPHDWEWPENGEIVRQAPARWSWRIDHSAPDTLSDQWLITTRDHMEMGTSWTRWGARRAQARAMNKIASR